MNPMQTAVVAAFVCSQAALMSLQLPTKSPLELFVCVLDLAITVLTPEHVSV